MHTRPFVNVPQNMMICYLDHAGVATRQRALNRVLATMTEAQAMAWLTTHPAIIQPLSRALYCQAVAQTLGITKLPAIVFNHHTVVYGMTDIEAAITIVRQHPKKRVDP